jgi:transcriptional regulator with XRE-family HTH domain
MGIQSVLARNAKRLRTLQGRSQRDMAMIAAVSQKTISNLETPDSQISPKLSTVAAIARYFRIHPAIMLMDGITDDALTDVELGSMIEQFAGLPQRRKRQIMDLISDLSSLGSD